MWTKLLNHVEITVPPSGKKMVHTLRSTLAYILINKDNGTQPGSRTYERSWIRDGAMTSSTMLKLGIIDQVHDYIQWYASHQYPNGKVPCVVDKRGPDPVPENDSHGEFLYLIYQYYLFTKDTLFLKSLFPNVAAAVGYIDYLLQLRKTAQYLKPDSTAFYGIMPESISHEGYSDKPRHSYWDDFYTMKGLNDAVEIARITESKQYLQRFTEIRDSFKTNLYTSISKAVANAKIDYIPGCVELGDFDATSTAIALYPCGQKENLPQQLLKKTFDRYFNYFSRRRDDTSFHWINYTPYEIRVAGAFIYLEQPERAHDLFNYFFKDQRPQGWNHWAEVVWQDSTTPRMIGDMPHTWVGSDYIAAARAFFVYERESDDALVLGAGLYKDWIESKEGVSIKNFNTYYGQLKYSIKKKSANSYEINIEKGISVPKGGIVFKSLKPGIKPKSVYSVNSNGQKNQYDSGKIFDEHIIINTIPIKLEVLY